MSLYSRVDGQSPSLLFVFVFVSCCRLVEFGGRRRGIPYGRFADKSENKAGFFREGVQSNISDALMLMSLMQSLLPVLFATLCRGILGYKCMYICVPNCCDTFSIVGIVLWSLCGDSVFASGCSFVIYGRTFARRDFPLFLLYLPLHRLCGYAKCLRQVIFGRVPYVPS